MIDMLSNNFVAQVLTALIGLGGISTFVIKAGKYLRMVKEAADVVIEIDKALEPDENGKIEVTPEEIKSIIKESEEAIEYWKNVRTKQKE